MDASVYKQKLEKERDNLLSELGYIGNKDKNNPEHYQARPAEANEMDFRDEEADRLEELAEQLAAAKPLEERLHNINQALKRIENGTFGFCEIGQEPIEEDRLTANPAARTCKKHIAAEENN